MGGVREKAGDEEQNGSNHDERVLKKMVKNGANEGKPRAKHSTALSVSLPLPLSHRSSHVLFVAQDVPTYFTEWLPSIGVILESDYYTVHLPAAMSQLY